MDEAKRARASAKSQLSKVGNFLQKDASEASSSKLSVKLEILEKYYAAFHKAQDEIEALVADETDLPKEMEESELFDELYCDMKAELLELIAKLAPSTSNSNSYSSNQPVYNNHEERFFKLPTIKIKPFNGNYLEWTSFSDLFRSMIDSHPRMSDVDKLCILKTLVEGEPLNLIQSLSITTQNYAEAWEKLENRYSNKSLIVKAHLSQIFSLEKCTTANVNSLKTVLDSVTTHVRALENLDLEPSSLSDAILFHIVTSKLDQRTKDLFDEDRNPDPNESNYARLIKFLTSRVNTLVDLPPGQDLQPVQLSKFSKRTAEVKAHQLTTSSTSNAAPITAIALTPNPTASSIKFRSCIDCKGNHPLFKCPQFNQKTVAERYETVKNAKDIICFNCFRFSHRAAKCTDHKSCKECGQKHHTLLHFPKLPEPPGSSAETANSSAIANTTVCTITQLATNQVLLATVSLFVKDAYGHNQQVRAFLDPGAQANLITKPLVDRLHLTTTPAALTLTGVTNLQRKSSQIVKCEILSRVSTFKTSLHAVVVPEICSKLPSQFVSTTKLPLSGKILADPDFHKPGNVDLLLSGENYLDLFIDGHIPETDESPSMRNTIFGWIVAGKSTIAKSRDETHEVLTNYCSLFPPQSPLINQCSISAALENFWSVENVDSSENSLTMEENACEKHFLENTTRLANGRFEVCIPFKAEPSVLGTSRDIAVKVLKYTQSRLNTNQRAEYKKFMDEYLTLGHMTKISKQDLTIPHAYLPHHPVIKTTSKTTKLRVVFNGSKPTSSGISVNDIQMNGPTIQNDIFSILIRFRFHKVAISMDVEKMYRQVNVRRQDQEFQRIVWFDSTGEISDYLLTTVTYGMTSSPFLAIRCLVQLAKEYSHEFPLASLATLKAFFVDDGFVGAATLAEARDLIRQLVALFEKGQFTLRKWASNQPSVLDGLDSHTSNVEFLVNSDETVGTLGISWLPTKDNYVLAVTLNENPDYNKRSILSEISKIFDPIGLATPVVIKFKLFLRDLWKRGCDWDEPLDPDLCDQWRIYRQSISSLRFERPRLVLPGATKEYEIHGLCDASIFDAKMKTCITLNCCALKAAFLQSGNSILIGWS